MRLIKIFLHIFALAGLGMFLAGVNHAWRMRHFIEDAQSASGTVIQNVWRQSAEQDGGTWSAYPQVRFRTRTFA